MLLRRWWKPKQKKKLVKEKKKKKRLEYLQQLWDEVLVEDTTLLEAAEDFQIMRTKCKKITTISSENKIG